MYVAKETLLSNSHFAGAQGNERERDWSSSVASRRFWNPQKTEDKSEN